jgi:hypothetical protein
MKRACFPSGTQPPYSWLLAFKGGELSSTNKISGSGTLSANQSNGINIEADLDGTGTISTASLALVTSMIAALTGSGTLTASMVGTVQLAAALTGSGTLAGAMNVLAGLSASLTGTGSIVADLKGKLFMEADIFVNAGTATTVEIASAVWEELAADHNTSGTMGEKLNAAGTAGDPWTTDLTSYNTANTAGKTLKQIKSIGQAGL